MTDLEFIKKFSKITISAVCKKCKVNSSNMYAGRLPEDKVLEVKECLLAELGKLLVEDYEQ